MCRMSGLSRVKTSLMCLPMTQLSGSNRLCRRGPSWLIRISGSITIQNGKTLKKRERSSHTKAKVVHWWPTMRNVELLMFGSINCFISREVVSFMPSLLKSTRNIIRVSETRRMRFSYEVQLLPSVTLTFACRQVFLHSDVNIFVVKVLCTFTKLTNNIVLKTATTCSVKSKKEKIGKEIT